MILVLGLGNVLMGDDGFGPTVVRAFEAEYVVPADVTVIDLGTPGLDLTPWLVDGDAVIIVDTVKSGLPAGTLKVYDKADLLRHPPAVRVAPHDPGLKETLLALEFAGRDPRSVTLVGVSPGRTDMALNLTPAVAAAVMPAVQVIAEALDRCGVRVVCRGQRRHAEPWWAPFSDCRAV